MQKKRRNPLGRLWSDAHAPLCPSDAYTIKYVFYIQQKKEKANEQIIILHTSAIICENLHLILLKTSHSDNNKKTEHNNNPVFP